MWTSSCAGGKQPLLSGIAGPEPAPRRKFHKSLRFCHLRRGWPRFVIVMSKLTKRDIVVAISNQTGMVQHEVFEVVQRTLDHITDSLAKNVAVELRNFGVFQPRLTKPRVGPNQNKRGSASVFRRREWIASSSRSKLIGLVRCSENPAARARLTSFSIPNPLRAIPRICFVVRS